MKTQDWIHVVIISVGGLLLILGLFWLGDTKDLLVLDSIEDARNTKAKRTELEKKITTYEKGSNQPEEFSLLGVELASAQRTGIIQKSTLNYFNQKLEDAYKNHVYILSEDYLTHVYKNKKFKYIDFLNHLEKSVGTNIEITEYKNQIDRVFYYQHQYPEMVTIYLSEREDTLKIYWNKLFLSKWQFPEDDIESIKYRLKNTQGLHPKYKNSKIKTANNNLLQKIENFENDYAKYSVDHKLDSIQRAIKSSNWP